jgi:5-methylcytosine-specific restriction endonuclease McrA
MPMDPFYQTKHWKMLRAAILKRDRYCCAIPGCNEMASVVDHIVPRKVSNDSSPRNLRSLCKLHDNQIKERPGGVRRPRDGLLPSICDADGMPTDPKHLWYR